jgi:competence protein ComEC
LFREAPLIWATLAFTLGLALHEYLSVPLWLSLPAAPLLAFGWHVASRSGREWTALVAGLLLVLALGSVRHAIYARPLPEGHIGLIAMPEKNTSLEGLVVETPVVSPDRGTTALLLDSRSISLPGYRERKTGGLVRATLHWTDTITAYGDLVRVSGSLIPPSLPTNPGQPDFRAAMARKGIHALLSAWTPGDFRRLSRDHGSRPRKRLLAMRGWATGRLEKLVGPPESGLLASIVFGLRSGDFSPEVLDAFRSTGLMHILVASGLNVGLLAMICLGLLGAAGLSRAQAAPVTIPILVFYLFLCGAEPPLLRSTLMFSLMVAGQMIGRPGNALNALGASGLILLAIDPAGPWDRSFQLSFMATLGVILMTSWFVERRGVVPKWMAEAGACTISAQLFLLPLLASLFGQLPLFGTLANLFVTPVMGIFLSGGILLLVLGWIPVVGPGLGLALKWCLLAVLYVIEAFARLPLASVVVPPFSPAGWMAYLTWISGVLLWMHASPRKKTADPGSPYSPTGLPAPGVERLERLRLAPLRHAGKASALAGAAVLAGLAWQAALRPAPGNLSITFLDVGEGSAIVIRLPSGRTLLVDGGPPYAGGSVVAPFLKFRGTGRLAGIIISHPHADHEGGLPAVLRQVRTDMVYVTGQGLRGDAGFAGILSVASPRHIPFRIVHSGMEIYGEPGVRIRFLSPPAGFLVVGPAANREDANSAVLAVEYGGTSALLPADIRVPTESLLSGTVRRLAGPQRLLGVPHHGSASASSRRFLETYNATHAVASVGAHNRFGHPHPAIVIRYSDQGTALARTDILGAVEAVSDGRLWTMGAAKR